MNTVVPLVALAGGIISLIVYPWYRSKRSIPLPPGPPGNLILGNALDVRNASAFWLKFAEYSEQYGPIVTIRILQMYHIIISDPRLVTELFDKRAANYSDRPVRYMVNLLGWDKDIIIFLSYGPKLKYYRTLLQRALNNRVAPDYVPLQCYEVRKFLRRLLDDPGAFMENVHFMSASIAVRMAYGHKVESPEDRFVQNAEEVMNAFSDALRPAKWVVDIFPLLRYVPAWFPFATFRRQIAAWQRLGNAYRDEPFEFAEGIAEDSFTSKLLQSEDGTVVDKETKDHVKSLAAALYGAASDTTVSVIQSFFLAMTLYPEVQAKAQTEIKAYLTKRLGDDPSASWFLLPHDRPRLPYTSALVRELLRWHPVANIIPHQSGTEDDEKVVSDGKTYRIPANTLVIVNAWHIMHNPDVYYEPGRFMPERYLVADPPPDPEYYAFGFGRSNVLANFNISKVKDEKGLDITPEERYTNDIIR
ncbi:cytochrome P450 family protein [Ceratobasidium sp. AG-Ba]|nr:cytochrome P450 family protein [Ceratobasidium sp. AG-Ba]